MASTGVAGGYQRRRFAGVVFVNLPTPPVPGPTFWLDASAITGQADSTALASWSDLSGNTHTFTAAGTAQPTYYKTTSAKLINGLPAVWFNGSTNQMTATGTLSQPFTLCVVAAVTSSSIDTFVADHSAGSTFLLWNFGQLALGAGGATQGVGSPLPGGSAVSFIGAFNGAASYGKLNATVTNAAATPGAGGLPSFAIGSRDGPQWPINGPICEVLAYPSALSAADATTVYNYFKAKWGTL